MFLLCLDLACFLALTYAGEGGAAISIQVFEFDVGGRSPSRASLLFYGSQGFSASYFSPPNGGFLSKGDIIGTNFSWYESTVLSFSCSSWGLIDPIMVAVRFLLVSPMLLLSWISLSIYFLVSESNFCRIYAKIGDIIFWVNRPTYGLQEGRVSVFRNYAYLLLPCLALLPFLC